MHRSNWWNRKCEWTTPVKINLITDEQIRFRIWQKKQDNYANDLVKTQVFASFHMRADDTRRKVLPKLFLIIELCVDTSSWCLSKKNQYSRGVGRYSTKIYTGRGRSLVREGHDPRSLPLPLYIPLLPDMAPLAHTEFRTLPTFLIAVNILS